VATRCGCRLQQCLQGQKHVRCKSLPASCNPLPFVLRKLLVVLCNQRSLWVQEFTASDSTIGSSSGLSPHAAAVLRGLCTPRSWCV